MKPLLAMAALVFALALALTVNQTGFTMLSVLGDASEKGEDMTEVRDDLDMLGRLVALPHPPRSARFSTRTLPGGSDWTLSAVLTLPEGAVAALTEGRAPATQDVDLLVPAWVPEEDLPATDAPIYEAEAFFKSPLLSGFMVPLGDNRVYLVMFTQ